MLQRADKAVISVLTLDAEDNMKKIEIIGQVIDFSKKATEVVKVLKAFLVGYEAFIKELNSNENEY